MSRYYRSFLEESIVTPSYPSSLKLFIDAGNVASYAGSGTTVTDLIGTQNGTLTNGVGYSSSNGGYFTFDGINDYIDFGINTTIQPTTNRTISTWCYFPTSVGSGALFSDGNYNSDRNGVTIAFSSGSGRTEIANASGYQIFSMGYTFLPDTWYFITIKWSGTDFRQYINGTEYSGGTFSSQPTNGVYSTKLGATASPASQFKASRISMLKINNVALSNTDITTDFNEFKSRYGY